MSMAWWWLLCNILAIIALAFYSMIEMACVSINKARLYFYAMKGSQRASWLQQLLNQPSRLFGTTLIGVNLATVVGSECAREFHASLGLDPDLAPISQVILMVIFGELAPMFAARHYAEHVALAGAPLLYFSARLLTPLLWSLQLLTDLINRLSGGKETSSDKFLSREELQKMLEAQEGGGELPIDQELSSVSASLFKMHNQTVGAVMTSLHTLTLLPADTTISRLREVWSLTPTAYAAIYQGKASNIVGIIQPRDVLRAKDERRVSDYARSPWFVTMTTTLSHMIRQFRRNNQNIAIIIDAHGSASGAATFNAILNEVFGGTTATTTGWLGTLLWEKTLPGSMTVEAFHQQFGVLLDEDTDLSLSSLVVKRLGHHPNVGDKLTIGPYEMTVKATSLLEIKSLSVTGRA